MLQMLKTMFRAVSYTVTHERAKRNGLCVRVIFLLTCALSIVSCHSDIPMVNLGIDETYAVERMRTLILHPEFTGESYAWRMNDSIISTERDLIFCQADTGIYNLRLDIYDSYNPITHNFKVVVWEEQVAYSPYISRVLEYNPAPGQFINIMPIYEEGDTYATMLQKAEESIAGTNNTLISLPIFS